MLGPMKTLVKPALARIVASIMAVSLIISMLPTTALADHGDYGELQSAAKEAVKTAQSSLLQADVDHAQELVDGLKAGNNKTLLQGRLDAVQGSINLREANAVIAAINALPPISTLALGDKPAVQQARAGYSVLTGDQKALVTNLDMLEAAEAGIDKLEADVAAALAVDNRIAALPAVDKLVLSDIDAVTAARAAYTALTADQKALATKLDSLTAAEARIAELKTAADKAAALAVDNQIIALPAVHNLVLSNKDAVAATRAAYMALTAEQKALVTKLDSLVAAENRIVELRAEVDRIAAWDVDTRITELPTVEELILYSKSDVESCRARYTALTADQKALVTKLAVLEAAEARIVELEADAAAASAVDDLIAALHNPYPYYYPPMTLSDKDDVYAAFAAYAALTADQKALVAVTNVEKLEAAKAKIDQMEADLPAALAVDALIATLPDVNELTLADKDAVYAAYAAFEALTYDQRQLVTRAATLALLHGKMDHMEVEAVPAFAVYDMIAALPPLDEITFFNAPAMEAVSAASEAYGRLSTSFQRSLVTNYAVLEAAEARVSELIADIEAAQAVDYQIDFIPYNLQVTDKPYVEAARAAYEALTEAQKQYVTRLAQLEAAEAEIARLEAPDSLEEAKNEAISAINALCSSLSEADYSPDEWMRIGQLRMIGTNVIQQVTTIEDINAVKNDFLAIINAIPKITQGDPGAVA